MSALEREIEQTRQRLATTIDQLAHRAHPKTIVGRQVTTVKSHFVELDSGAPRTDNILKAAGAVVGVIVLLGWRYLPAVRWWVTPLLVLPLVTLVARLYMGAHHLTDVLTSLLYASAWLATLTVLVLHLHRSRRPEAGRASARSGVMPTAEQ